MSFLDVCDARVLRAAVFVLPAAEEEDAEQDNRGFVAVKRQDGRGSGKQWNALI
jgi:hypothetical protein